MPSPVCGGVEYLLHRVECVGRVESGTVRGIRRGGRRAPPPHRTRAHGHSRACGGQGPRAPMPGGGF
eukprot:scaffold2035_cov101-Isochrysis_galbana.AAC.1